MLAIRMQRTGRKGHAMFRMVVQDSRRTPTSGKVVARLGSYDPHSKTLTLDKEKTSLYLEHGAQPSDRVIFLLQKEGVKLPAWAGRAAKKESAVRNPDKRRSTRPEEPQAEEADSGEAPVTEDTPAEAEEEAPAKGESSKDGADESPAEAEKPGQVSDETVGKTSGESAAKPPADDAENGTADDKKAAA